MRAPFPWFGGKSRIAKLVWPRFGDVANYVEPFAGSLAVLLGRPHEARVETVNDKDAYLANFWRALRHDPDKVAWHADSPVNETDLHARHQWLVHTGRSRVNRLLKDPDYFDAKIAGWWVWGQCLWIGSGWCANAGWRGRVNAGRAARGVNRVWRKKPGARRGDSAGVHRRALHRSGSRGAVGRGVHRCGLTPETGGLYAYLHALATRLRRVRVCCGEWNRVLTPSVTTCIGVTGVLLDPPYEQSTRAICYSQDENISGAVRRWALSHGDDPKFRIVVCGYEGEHTMPDSWECVPWKAHGGYSRSARGVANRSRERLWFSPHCDRVELPLFERMGASA